ncbi:MAG: DUF21 domain-containing protein [Desulfomicrobium escambiense]|nr:DUF21 domain-containing protein [Desulfomicrobium escambiense]
MSLGRGRAGHHLPDRSIIGELVPKQIALNHAERISAAVAPASCAPCPGWRCRSCTCSAVPPSWCCGSSASNRSARPPSPRRRSS